MIWEQTDQARQRGLGRQMEQSAASQLASQSKADDRVALALGNRNSEEEEEDRTNQIVLLVDAL